LHYILDTRARVRGIAGLSTEPVFADIPRQSPVGIYQANNKLRRAIEFDLTIRGSRGEDVASYVQDLRQHLHIDVGENEQGLLVYSGESGERLAIEAAISDPADGVSDWAWAPTSFGQDAAKLTLRFECGDPTWRAYSPSTASGAFAGVGNVNVSCANAGDVDAYVTLLYDTDAVNTLVDPQVTDYRGNVLEVEGTVAINQTLTIVAHPGDWSITYSGAPSNWSGNRALGSKLPVVASGTHNLVFTAGNAGANAAILATWYNRYSSHPG
jgi:hypothetical protein